MAIQFDKTNKIIEITSGQTSVEVQDLINAIRDYEDNDINMELESLANATGKQALGGGTLVGITLELINNWQVAFSGWQGPSAESVFVVGGNFIATNDFLNNPVNGDQSPFTTITIAQSSSATIVLAGVARQDIADAVWDTETSGYQTSGTFGEKVGSKLLTVAKFLGLK